MKNVAALQATTTTISFEPYQSVVVPIPRDVRLYYKRSGLYIIYGPQRYITIIIYSQYLRCYGLGRSTCRRWPVFESGVWIDTRTHLFNLSPRHHPLGTFRVGTDWFTHCCKHEKLNRKKNQNIKKFNEKYIEANVGIDNDHLRISISSPCGRTASAHMESSRTRGFYIV